MKKKTTVYDIIENIAKSHLGIGDLTVPDVRNLSILSIRVALLEALKAGERVGYNNGYDDAKKGCGKEKCECEYSLFN